MKYKVGDEVWIKARPLKEVCLPDKNGDCELSSNFGYRCFAHETDLIPSPIAKIEEEIKFLEDAWDEYDKGVKKGLEIALRKLKGESE